MKTIVVLFLLVGAFQCNAFTLNVGAALADETIRIYDQLTHDARWLTAGAFSNKKFNDGLFGLSFLATVQLQDLIDVIAREQRYIDAQSVQLGCGLSEVNATRCHHLLEEHPLMRVKRYFSTGRYETAVSNICELASKISFLKDARSLDIAEVIRAFRDRLIERLEHWTDVKE